MFFFGQYWHMFNQINQKSISYVLFAALIDYSKSVNQKVHLRCSFRRYWHVTSGKISLHVLFVHIGTCVLRLTKRSFKMFFPLHLLTTNKLYTKKWFTKKYIWYVLFFLILARIKSSCRKLIHKIVNQKIISNVLFAALIDIK